MQCCLGVCSYRSPLSHADQGKVHMTMSTEEGKRPFVKFCRHEIHCSPSCHNLFSKSRRLGLTVCIEIHPRLTCSYYCLAITWSFVKCRFTMAPEIKAHLSYQLLDDESEKGETDNFLSQRSSSSVDGPQSWYKPQRHPMRSIIVIFPWVSSFLLAVLSLLLFLKIQYISREFGTYETGFRPDMSECHATTMKKHSSH